MNRNEKIGSLAIMQPYFFPYIGYFQLINAVENMIIYDNVRFAKKTWITRNRLLDRGTGEIVPINIPVSGASSKKLISEISISNSENWRNKLLGFIHHNYSNAIYYSEVRPLVDFIFAFETNSLTSFNAFSTVQICKFLNINTSIILDYHASNQIEEKVAHLKKEDRMQHRVVLICQEMKAKTYINPIGGQSLYFKNFFQDYNLGLQFIKTEPFEYKQFQHEHSPYLSIIDILMHNGQKGTQDLLEKYTFV